MADLGKYFTDTAAPPSAELGKYFDAPEPTPAPAPVAPNPSALDYAKLGFRGLVKEAPLQFASTVAGMIEGPEGVEPANPDIGDQIRGYARRSGEKYAQEVRGKLGDTFKAEMVQAIPSLGYSAATLPVTAAATALGTIAGTAAGGAAGLPTGPGALTTAGAGAVSGAVAGLGTGYLAMDRAAQAQILGDLAAQEEQRMGRPFTESEFAAFKANLDDKVAAYGGWEAGPEALSNVIDLAILRRVPGAGALVGLGKKALGIAATELPTETITQIGQSQALEGTSQARPDGPLSFRSPQDVGTAAREVLPGVLVVGGGMTVANAALEAVADKVKGNDAPAAELRQRALDVLKFKARNPDVEVSDQDVADFVAGATLTGEAPPAKVVEEAPVIREAQMRAERQAQVVPPEPGVEPERLALTAPVNISLASGEVIPAQQFYRMLNERLDAKAGGMTKEEVIRSRRRLMKEEQQFFEVQAIKAVPEEQRSGAEKAKLTKYKTWLEPTVPAESITEQKELLDAVPTVQQTRTETRQEVQEPGVRVQGGEVAASQPLETKSVNPLTVPSEQATLPETSQGETMTPEPKTTMPVTADAERLFAVASAKLPEISGRRDLLLRVAEGSAKLDGKTEVSQPHLAEAVQYVRDAAPESGFATPYETPYSYARKVEVYQAAGLPAPPKPDRVAWRDMTPEQQKQAYKLADPFGRIPFEQFGSILSSRMGAFYDLQTLEVVLPDDASATTKASLVSLKEPGPEGVTPPPKGKKPTPPAGKQAWEMTKAEFVVDYSAGVPEFTKITPGLTDSFTANHKLSVERALAEGKAVPAEVLADYPDLQPTPEARIRAERRGKKKEEAKVEVPVTEEAPASQEVTLPRLKRGYKRSTFTVADPVYKNYVFVEDVSPKGVTTLYTKKNGEAEVKAATPAIAEKVGKLGRTEVALAQQPGMDPDATEATEVQAGVEGKTVVEMAQFLAENGPNDSYKLIADKVRTTLRRYSAAGATFETKVYHLGDSVPGYMAVARGASSITYKAGVPEVVVMLNGADVTGKVGVSYETALHELVHAATQAAIYVGNRKSAQGTPLAQSVTDLYAVTNAVIDRFNTRAEAFKKGTGQLTPFEERILKGGANPLATVDEVLTWALSNGEMQAYLETIPYQQQTLWSKFVEAVRTLLGLDAKQGTALSEVLRVSEDILDAPVNQIMTEAKVLGGGSVVQTPVGSQVNTQISEDPIIALTKAIQDETKQPIAAGTFTQVSPPKGQEALFAALAQTLKKEIIFFKNNGSPMSFNGATGIAEDTIYVNIDSVKPHLVVTGHEFLHDLKREEPETYAALRDVVMDVIPEKRRLEMWKGLTAKRLREGRGPISMTAIDEELVADFFGEQFTSKEFWAKVERRNPEGFAGLVQRLIAFLDRIKAALTGEARDDIERAQTAAAEALARYVAKNPEAVAETQEPVVDPMFSETPKKNLQALKDSLLSGRVTTQALPSVLKVTPLPILADVADTMRLPWVRTFYKATMQRDAVSNGIVTDFGLLGKELAQNKETSTLVANVADVASIHQMRPQDDIYSQDWIAEAMRGAEGAKPETKEALLKGAQTAWEAAGMQTSTGKTFREAYLASKQAFDALSEDLQEHYLRAVEMMKDLRQREKDAAQALIEEHTQDNLDLRAEQIAQLDFAYNNLKGNYWPVYRKGDYTLDYIETATGLRGYSSFDTVFEREVVAKSLVDSGLVDPATIKLSKKADTPRGSYGVPAGYNTALGKAIEEKAIAAATEGIDPKDVQALETATAQARQTAQETIQTLHEVWLRFQPEASAAKNMMRRKNIKGYDGDMVRGFLEYGQTHGVKVAQMEQGRKVERTINDMAAAIRGMSGDTTREMAILNDLRAREAVKSQPSHWLAKKLGAWTTFRYMTSPSIALVQMTQLGILTFPKLATLTGSNPTKAAGALRRGTQAAFSTKFTRDQMLGDTAVQAVYDSLHEVVTTETRRENPGQYDDVPLGTAVYTPAELQNLIDKLTPYQQQLLALQEAMDRGLLDISLSHEVNEQVERKDMNPITGRVFDLGMTFMRESEKASRKAAILAAFEVGGGAKDFFAGMETVAEVVDNTLFNYSKSAKGVALQGDLVRVLTTFQTFRINAIGKLFVLFRQTIKGETAEVQQAAKRELIGIFGMSGILAGTLGMPFAPLIFQLFDAIIGDDDDEPAEEQFRKWLAENFGQATSDVVAEGLPSLLGASLSRRIGLGDVVGSSAEMPARLVGDGALNWYATQLAGPSYSMVAGYAKGYNEIFNEGEIIKGLISSTPKPIGDALKAYGYAKDGVKTGMGKRLLTADQVGPNEVLLQAFGFAPLEISRLKSKEYDLTTRSTKLSMQWGQIKQDLVKAYIDGEPTDQEMIKVREFVAAHPGLVQNAGGEIRSSLREYLKKDSGMDTRRETLLKR